MKRMVGTFLLVAGLSGCIALRGQPDEKEKKTSTAKASTPPAKVVAKNQPATAPAPAKTDGDPDRVKYQLSANFPPASPPPDPPPPVPLPLVAPPIPLSPQVSTASVPLHPVPPPTIRQQSASPSPVVTANAVEVGSEPSSPGHMPMVITPNGEPIPTKPVSLTQEDSRQAPVVNAKLDVHGTAPPLPSLPTVQRSHSDAARATPLMRLVNTKRITLNFEIKDVGSSGLSSVELWYTRDCKEWKKYETPTKAKAYLVEVDEEGMYGFTLVARSGTGLGKEPPSRGDQPQMWVIVDLTKPDVKLTEAAPNATSNTPQVGIHWKASDKNLGPEPITLYYAASEEGPWKVMASNLENTGLYQWAVPPDAPSRCVVRVEVRDLAGNVGRAQWTTSVALDTQVPTASIVNIQASGEH